MAQIFKISNNFFFYLLSIVVFVLIIFIGNLATATTKLNGYDTSFLRGEIWYGNASWYGSKFHGKRTSSGEKFSRHRLTAAHKNLPFNTMVLVTNLRNNKTVIVRINDRGPFVDNRIIDLSEKAAKEIGLKEQGIAYIKLQILNPLAYGYSDEAVDKS